MKPRIVFIHGNDTEHWSFGWAGWLKRELKKHDYPTFFETFPDSILAREKYWLPFLKDHVKASEKDVLVGWSSGAVASMRFAETNRILGSILVSPCCTDLGDQMEKQSGYYDKPWSWENIRRNQKSISMFYSNDDPFIPQTEFELIAEKLNLQTHVINGGKHFSEFQEFPQLLNDIMETYSH